MFKQLLNKKLLTGLTAVFLSLVIIMGFVTSLAISRAGNINQVLNINTTVKGDGEEVYKSEYDSEKEMLAADVANEIETQTEGTVLLKNDGALPLAVGSKVTILGRSAGSPIYKGRSGSRGNGALTSPEQGFEEAGLEVNSAVCEAMADISLPRDNKSIGEPDITVYDSLKSTFKNYGDAAVIILGRIAGENVDYGSQSSAGGYTVNGESGIPMLSLHRQEKELIKLAKANFSKVIVLLNTGSSLEVDELLGDGEYGVDACMWIGFPGENGFDAIGNMLVGKSSPSGRLTDTWATNSLSSPAMQNFGDFTFDGLTEQYKNKYIIYSEGIYVGYRYYETRYYDAVKDRNNADGKAGSFVNADGWDYAAEMSRPFGYGLSYALFTQKLDSVEWNRDTNKLTTTVTVKREENGYDGPANELIQLYVSLPYIEGGVEKSAIQLIGFKKTDNIAVGEEKQYTIEVSDYNFATYDDKAVNGADASRKGCYIFDEGDYYFSIGKDCHDALNNVLACENSDYTLTDADGNAVTVESVNAKKIVLEKYDNVTYAKSANGEIVCNQFEKADWTSYQDAEKAEYLTRSDWNTFPESHLNLKATAEMQKGLDGHVYAEPADSDMSKYVKGRDYAVDLGDKAIDFVELKDYQFEDDVWKTFLSQLTIQQLCNIVAEKKGENGVNSVNFPSNQTNDGPDGSYKLHVSQNVAAATFNEALWESRGKFLGEEALWLGADQAQIYGPGANIHRTPYSGRGFEYSSEDGLLSGVVASCITTGLQGKGLIAVNKHFALNDQETNRHGLATFLNEQSMRELYLKGFEAAFTQGGALATMSSFNRIGVEPGFACSSLLTQVLRNEWGFKGICKTDASGDTVRYCYAAECVDAGTTVFTNDSSRNFYGQLKDAIDAGDSNLFEKAVENAKYFFYAYSRSNVVNGLEKGVAVQTSLEWWRLTLYVVDAVFAAFALASVALLAITYIQSKRGKI